MARNPTWLLDHSKDVYSQSGEDGIIQKILETLPDTNGWCVEFGAWDGIYLSNSRNLIENFEYSSVLIEADSKKFLELQENYQKYKNVILLNHLVGFSENDNLDTILEKTAVPLNFDLLSIDIDGNDYHIWKAVSKYRPKVVVIEYNPTIPSEVYFVQSADFRVKQGASLLALTDLGTQKGYELISVLPFNAFFVANEYYKYFSIDCNSIQNLRKNMEYVTYIYSGYDGKIILSGYQMLPWHKIHIKNSNIQCLPSLLRRHPGDYTTIHKVALRIYRLFLGWRSRKKHFR